MSYFLVGLFVTQFIPIRCVFVLASALLKELGWVIVTSVFLDDVKHMLRHA
jgi:hypothetical protein